MENPMDYSLCNQTVTLYRLQEQQVIRKVLAECYLEYKTQQDTGSYGTRMERPFLLIVPCRQQDKPEIPVMPGDRIYAGIGPEVTNQQWRSFVPANVAELMQAEYVQPCYFGGHLCHTEAGRKSHGLSR